MIFYVLYNKPLNQGRNVIENSFWGLDEKFLKIVVENQLAHPFYT